jgi:hypothetical protein
MTPNINFFSTWVTFNYVEIILKVVNINGQPHFIVTQANADLGQLEIDLSGDIIAPIANAIQSLMHDKIRQIVQDAVNDNVIFAKALPIVVANPHVYRISDEVHR